MNMIASSEYGKNMARPISVIVLVLMAVNLMGCASYGLPQPVSRTLIIERARDEVGDRIPTFQIGEIRVSREPGHWRVNVAPATRCPECIGPMLTYSLDGTLLCFRPTAVEPCAPTTIPAE